MIEFHETKLELGPALGREKGYGQGNRGKQKGFEENEEGTMGQNQVSLRHRVGE